ncbi:MAG: PPOX class F420-dependent oxidoreductase [Chloroflexi bacterium]|nr:PPOX class F420-dependent oxidoreductase [Chloroflexota bacterium]
MSVKIPEGVKKLFRGKNFGHVATLLPDGSPHSTAVWVDVEGEHIVFNSDESYVKVKNLRRDPRVTISIIDMNSHYTGAMIRGKVVAFRNQGAGDHIDRLARKYLGDGSFTHTPDERRVIVEIEPEEIYSSGV